MNKLALGLVVFVLLAAALDLKVGLRSGPEPVSLSAMTDAAQKMRAMKKPGDVLVHSPLFGVTELQALGDLRARPDLPTEQTRLNRRVILLDRLDYPMGGFAAAAKVEPLQAPLALFTFEPAGGADLVRFSLTQDFDSRTMSIERPAGTEVSKCTKPRPEGGFSCPGQADWLRASTEMMRVGGKDRDCMWAHPTASGAVVYTLPAQDAPPEGHELRVMVQSGLTDDAVSQTPGGAEVRTRITQDGSLGQLVAPNKIGWYETDFAIAPNKPVRLEVMASRDGRRHHCLAARIIERAADKP